MEIFGFKIEKKSIGFGGSFATLMQGAYEEKPMNFNSYYDMYRINADVKSCIREIQNTVGKSGYKIFQRVGVKNNGKIIYKDISSNVFIKAFLNNSANVKIESDEWGAYNIIKKEFLKHLKVSGNLFLLKKRNKVGKLSSIEIIDTRNVNIMVDSQYNVLYYVCRKGSAVFEVKPDDMFHFVLTYDVKDIVYGISDLSGVVYEVYSDNEASITNYYAMLNNNVPAGLYILKEGVDDTKAKQILNDVKREVKGSKNRNKSIVSNAIQDFKSMAQSNTDMDFVELRKFNSEKICSALGVPKSILSYTEGINYSNGENQYTKYIENTIRPLEMEINYIFSTILSEIIPNIYFEIIDNHINDKKEKGEFAEKMIKNGLRTRNEAREYIGETEIIDNDLMNKFTVGNDVKLIEDLEFSITDPDLGINKKSL